MACYWINIGTTSMVYSHHISQHIKHLFWKLYFHSIWAYLNFNFNYKVTQNNELNSRPHFKSCSGCIFMIIIHHFNHCNIVISTNRHHINSVNAKVYARNLLTFCSNYCTKRSDGKTLLSNWNGAYSKYWNLLYL